MPGKDLICVLCVQKQAEHLVKEAAREKRKVKQADKRINDEKTAVANEIHRSTNPFNYNQMKKVLKEKKLEGFLIRDQMKKEEQKKRDAKKKRSMYKAKYGYK
jgi:hypothetical protein